MTNEEKIQLLAQKLSLLSANVDKQKSEIELIRQQLSLLSNTSPKTVEEKIQQIITPVVEKLVIEEVKIPVQEPIVENIIKQEVIENKTIEPSIKPIAPVQATAPAQKPSFNLEEYIGGKLASILGIIALVIGVSIGVKYAIDKDLINPVTRVIFGFLAGGIMLTFAFIFKKKYQLFSAIILGGAVATLFFSSYAGFAFYGLYPKLFAFALMFIITAFTVFAAHSYNYEVIAVIGLVGSYAVPVLLSDGTGKIEYMFTYMSIINVGILILSLFKNWNWVKYFAYGLTWLITAAWTLNKYSPEKLNMAIAFLSIFFLTFYFTFIGYKLLKNIPFKNIDIASLLSNSTIYFGLGYFVFNNQFTEKYLGLFCVFNAVIHMGVAYWAFSRKINDKNILNFLIVLCFTFITIAIPVQLEGNWVTIIWFTEMLLLFVIGKKTNFEFFKVISYCLAILGFFSLTHDWAIYYLAHWDRTDKFIKPVVLNKMFMTSVIALVSLGVVSFLNKKPSAEIDAPRKSSDTVISILSPILLHIVLFGAIFFEIISYFQNWVISSPKIPVPATEFYTPPPIEDKSIFTFMALWLLIYTTLYFAVSLLINSSTKKSNKANWILYCFALLFLTLSITTGLSGLGQLRTYYFSMNEEFFPAQFKTEWFVKFRYVLFVFTALSIGLIYFSQRLIKNKTTSTIFTWIMHLSILTLLSSELVQQFRNYNSEDVVIYEKIAKRMGFTILWALYSCVLITFGILRKMKMLRIMGFSLFGVTLIKLLTDTVHMSLGYKLIVYISVGLILMVIGFLYQRFKQILFGDDKEN
jgi:uncharacterized membrane protein